MVGCSSSNGGSSNAGVSSSQSSALSSLYNLKGQSSAGSSSFSSQSIGTASGGGCDFYTIENFDSTSATSQDTISCAQSIDVSGLKNDSIEDFTSTLILGVKITSTDKNLAFYSAISGSEMTELIINDAKLSPNRTDGFSDNGVAQYIKVDLTTFDYYYSVQTWTEADSISTSITKDDINAPVINGNVSYISIGSKDDVCGSSNSCKIYVGAYNKDSGKIDLYTADFSSVVVNGDDLQFDLKNSNGNHIGYVIVGTNMDTGVTFSVVDLDKKQFI